MNINFTDENILLDYDNYTYNIKLSIPSFDDYIAVAKNKDTFNTAKNDHIIIAQSGVTQRYTIGSLVVTNIPNGAEARNSIATAMEVDIIEAGSMRFMDDMFYTINQLGYDRDWGVPMIVEIDFIGYDSQTGNPTTIPNVYRSFAMTITDIKMKQRSSTSDINQYTISLLPMQNKNDSMYLKSYGVENIQTNGTVFDVLSSLELVLNESFFTAYPKIAEFYPSNMLTFHCDTSIGNLYVAASGQGQGDSNDSSQANFSFNEEDDIFTTIDKIMNYTTPDENERRSFVKVVPQASFVGFDKITGQYIYSYDVYIKEYRTFDALSAHEIKNNLTWNDFSTRFTSNSLTDVIKRYYHTYSGLNKEVLSMQLDFNNTWHYSLSINSNSLVDQENRLGSSVSQTQSEQSVEEENAELVGSTQKEANSPDEQVGSKQIMENFAYGQTISPVFDISFKFKDTGRAEGSSATLSRSEIHNYDQMSMYYSRSNLLSCQMKVVGDPRWLGLSDSELSSVLNDLDGNLNSSEYNSDFFRQEALIQIRINTAPTFDSNILKNRSTIYDDSIYKIIEIKSTFKNGQFTQDIKGNVIKSTLNNGVDTNNTTNDSQQTSKSSITTDKTKSSGSAISYNTVDSSEITESDDSNSIYNSEIYNQTAVQKLIDEGFNEQQIRVGARIIN